MTDDTLDGLLPVDAEVDLTNCDREPIHRPGGVQAHGALALLHPDTLQVLAASRNAEAVLGIRHGRAVPDALAPAVAELRDEAAEAPRDADGFTDGGALEPLTVDLGGTAYDLSVHRTPEGLLLEGEPTQAIELDTLSRRGPVRRALAALDRVQGVAGLLDEVVRQVRALTGYDRVMVYRFDADGSGEVVAEARRDADEPFLGLRYPATDVPEQARTLYVLNRIRVLGDVDAAPVPVDGVAEPLDLRYAALRAVSPVHLEYLRNMGVQATMSVSIVQDGALWGLIACHHHRPFVPPPRVRSAVDLVGQVLAMQLESRIRSDASAAASERLEAVVRITERAVGADLLSDALAVGEPSLLDVVPAEGAAIVLDERVMTLGTTPPADSLETLLRALGETVGGALLATAECTDDLPDAAPSIAPLAGVLAVPITPDWRAGVLWFRREAALSVTWAGRPGKQSVQEADGSTTLLPRASFAAWTESVAGRCGPFDPADRLAASELRRAVVRVVLARVQELARLNEDLERSNEELDAFTYIASHDLKEPLRGIHNYAQFVIEDYADTLDDAGRQKLDTIARLSHRLDAFIDSLLEYSRVGREQLRLRPVPLAEAVAEAADLLPTRLDGAELVVGDLPTVQADRPRVIEVMTNLIGNAVKYNASDVPRVTVEARPAAALGAEDRERIGDARHVITVRDNGIGIPERHRESVFRIFKRLHGRDAYGGGTGAGLTIVERIVRRHGGVIWVTAPPDGGTAFHFTLEPRGDLSRQ